MPSPFPGMNPYLEQTDAFHDFHERLCPALAEALTPYVVPKYIVKLDQHVYIHELPAEQRRLVGRSDALVASRSAAGPGGTGPAVVQAPVYGQVFLAVDVERHSFVQVLDRLSRRIVTVIELLSPSNKYSGSDRDQYIAKREEVLRGPAHLVEIDLLRGGPRLPVEGLPDCAYCVLVSRSDDRPRVGLWPIGLRRTFAASAGALGRRRSAGLGSTCSHC